jgi:hypothetical protein
MQPVLWIQQRLKSLLTRLVIHTMADTPVAGDFRFIVKQSLSKKSRMALGEAMVRMCSLYGWQATTLNVDMGDSDKMALLTTRYSKIALTDDPGTRYDELVELAAVTMGWAQAIARAQRKQERKAAKKK